MKNLLKNISYCTIGYVTLLNLGCFRYEAKIPKTQTIAYIQNEAEIQVSRPINSVRKISGSNNAIIKDDSARAPHLVEMKFLRLGLESKLKEDILLDIYGNLSLNSSYFFPLGAEKNKIKSIDTPETSKIGNRPAFTYYRPIFSPAIIPGVNAELKCPLKNLEDAKFIIGVGYRKFDLDIERGYDKNNELVKVDKNELAKINEKSIYLGLELKRDNIKYFFKTGVNFNETYNEKAEIIVTNPSYFLSLGIKY